MGLQLHRPVCVWQRHFATSSRRVKIDRYKWYTKDWGKENLLSKVSTSTAFTFLSIVCTPAWQQLQNFYLLFAGAATATVQLLTFWKLAKKWFDYERRPFYMLLFWLRIDWQLVTAQLQPVTDHSPTIRRPISTACKPISVRIVNSCRQVSDQSLKVAKPIAD